ncbi:MAG TPA: DNA mismatch repair endonuclease MutL, partial [Bacilli bacterium]|nr:DNA mismatch repair endonuclease MutL [Bacilli bacterium]
ELVENSIDAKASEIKIELKESGTKMIKVTDNGIGMSKEDALLAFERHATSKLLSEFDLFRISSLGYRGEALPSIAAISKVILKTCNSNIGTEISINGGIFNYQKASDARVGTSIEVSDIFYNTPARLKFMNSLYSELANIVEYINKMALSYPNIKFKITNYNKVLLNTDGNDNILKNIKEIYGTDIARKMINVEGYNDDYDIYGYISMPEITKSNRNNIITFVNKRLVRNNELNRTMLEVYNRYIPENRYPIIVLNIICDPSFIDVNIHPSKMDVKFSQFNNLKDLVSKKIKEALDSNLLIPSIESKEKSSDNKTYTNLTFDIEREFSIEEKADVFEKVVLPELYSVGLVSGTYIICQNESGMYIIDQHAAKERINLEKYIKNLSNVTKSVTSLLVPLILEFPKNEFILINKNIDVLIKLGLDISEYGNNAFIIKKHPTWLLNGYEEESIKKILEVFIEENKNFSYEKFIDNVAETLSCKLAIKANENISISEMESLINDLRKCDNPYTCAHGRPTIIFYSNYELEKLFKRVM